MQTLKSAAVVFCTACICAELLARLTGNSWARRCIKAEAVRIGMKIEAHARGRLGALSENFALAIPRIDLLLRAF